MNWGSILNNVLNALATTASITGITGATIFMVIYTKIRKNKKQPFERKAKTSGPLDQSQLSPSLTWRQWGNVLGVALMFTLTSEDALRSGMPILPLFVYMVVGLLLTGFIYGVLFLFGINTLMNEIVTLKVWLVSSFLVALLRFIYVAVDYRDELLGVKQETIHPRKATLPTGN